MSSFWLVCKSLPFLQLLFPLTTAGTAGSQGNPTMKQKTRTGATARANRGRDGPSHVISERDVSPHNDAATSVERNTTSPPSKQVIRHFTSRFRELLPFAIYFCSMSLHAVHIRGTVTLCAGPCNWLFNHKTRSLHVTCRQAGVVKLIKAIIPPFRGTRFSLELG